MAGSMSFVPGDTVTLGWEQFAVGLDQDSREELDYLFQEWEMEQDPEEMIRESMAPVRQAAIGPMLVGRELEELCWEPVTMDDPRLSAHPDWLKQFREFAWSDLDSLTLHQSTRIERTEKGFQIYIYNRTDYDELPCRAGKAGALAAYGGRVGLSVRRRVPHPVPLGGWNGLLHAPALV